MSKRKSYTDTQTGAIDRNIRLLLNENEGDDRSRLKRILLNIIKNDLTARQKEIIMLYYFKGEDTPTIAKRCGVSTQAVSAVMARARKRIFRILKYYMGEKYL